MADKKITNKSLVGDTNPFQPTQDQAADFKKVIDSLNRSFKKNEEVYQKMIEQGVKLASLKPLQGYDNIKEIERGIKQVEKANKSLILLKQKEQQVSSKISKLKKQEEAQLKKTKKAVDELQKSEAKILETKKKQEEETNKLTKQEEKNLKLKERLKNASSDLAKENALLEEQAKRQEKALKDEAKAALDAGKEAKDLTKEEQKNIRLKEQLIDSTSELAKENALLQEELNRNRRANREDAKAALDSTNEYKKLEKQVREAQQEFKRLAAQYGVNSEQALEAEEAFIKVADRLKEIDDRARDGRKSVGLYKQELSGLQEEAKNASDSLKQIILEFGGNSKEAKKARKELRQLTKTLDNVEQQARDAAQGVTRLESSLDKTNQKLTRLNNIARGLGLIALFNAFTEAVKGTDEGADGLQRGIGRLTLSLTAIVQALLKVGTAFKNGKGFLDAFSEGFENFGDGLDKAFTALDEQIRLTRVLRKAQADASVQLERLNTQVQFYQALSDASNISFTEQRKALSLLNVTLKEQNNIQLELAQTQLRVARAQREAKQTTETLEALRAAEANLIKVQNERLQANLERFTRITEILSDQAELELDIAIDAADNQKTINERRISNEEEFLAERERLTQENNKIIEESFAFQIEILEDAQRAVNSKLANQFAREEKMLTQRIEGNEKIIESNEKLIKSLSKDESARIKNAKQIEQINKNNEDLSKKNFDLNSLREDAINKQRRLRGKVVIDTNKLINESDIRVLNNNVRNLGLSEKLQTRLLEVIKERKTALQDLEETQKDLNTTFRETRSLENDLLAQGDALNQLIKKNTRFRQIQEELEKRINDNRKQEIEERLREIDKERTARQLAIQAQLSALEATKIAERRIIQDGKETVISTNNEELEDKKKRLKEQLEATESSTQEELKLRQKLLEQLIDEEAEAGRKIIEQRVKIQQAASEVLTGFSEKFFEGELNRLDEQLEAVRNRQNEIRELSQRNVQSAGDALAFQQRREAELEREREQERKRQEKSKLLFAILDTVSAKAAAGDPEPLKSAALDTAFLRLIVENFPSFAVGTEALGKVNKPVDNQGGRVIIAHENERILTSSQNDSLDGHPSNDMLVAGYNIGKAYINGGVSTSSGIGVGLANAIISGLEKVNNTIDRKPVHTGTQVDVIRGIVTDIIESEGVKIKYHQKYTRKH